MIPLPPYPPNANQRLIQECFLSKSKVMSGVVVTTLKTDLPRVAIGRLTKKATRAFGETMYVSIDYSTRVFVECYLPSTKFAYVRVQEPSYLREHRGWVPSSVLSLNLGSTQKASKSKSKSHIVVYDTRDKYQEAPVDFIQTSSAVCGSGGRRGVRGAGVVKFFSPPETLPVEIIPCAEGGLTYVKLPDGRVLHLRKSI